MPQYCTFSCRRMSAALSSCVGGGGATQLIFSPAAASSLARLSVVRTCRRRLSVWFTNSLHWKERSWRRRDATSVWFARSLACSFARPIPLRRREQGNLCLRRRERVVAAWQLDRRVGGRDRHTDQTAGAELHLHYHERRASGRPASVRDSATNRNKENCSAAAEMHRAIFRGGRGPNSLQPPPLRI